MMTDPYQVLGISPNASNDEVKRAYRELSRKYHPDSYVDNPLSELAEAKFKEVQEAYDMIMKQREGGFHANYQNSYGKSGDNGEFGAVVTYIQSGQFREALTLLNGINNRNGQWYYLSAVANMGIGNNFQALNYARQAVAMEPNNPEYASFLNRLQNGNGTYQNTSYNMGRSQYSCCDCCCDLWCTDTLCECMGGDLCLCM